MTKGKYGLNLTAIAVIAFVFAMLRQPTAVLLVCGFALLAEKDEWLNKQAMQALLLTIAYNLANMLTGLVFGYIVRFFRWAGVYAMSNAINKIDTFVGDVIYIALIVFSVIAIIRVLRGKDAALPILSKMASGDMATAVVKEAKSAPPVTQAVPPVPAPPQQAPSTGKVCLNCSAQLKEDAQFCIECGTKVE